MSASVAGIILAAGMGRRLGLGPKAFVSLHGASLLELAVNRLRRCGVSPIVTVLPPGPDPIELPEGLIVVRNDSPDSGPLGSACLGAGALPSALQVALIYPVDHHAVTDRDVARVIDAQRDLSPDVGRVVPRWNGRGGHPVLLMPSALKALREVASPASMTLRDVLDSAGTVHGIEAASEGVRRNLNLPVDLPRGGPSLAREPQ
mgnify:CR=1 FL=1